MVALSDLGWLQGAFSTLFALFDRVGINTNITKTAGIVFRPCQAAGTQSGAEYGRRMMGSIPSYWERQSVWVPCMECREEMALGLLVVHI